MQKSRVATLRSAAISGALGALTFWGGDLLLQVPAHRDPIFLTAVLPVLTAGAFSVVVWRRGFRKSAWSVGVSMLVGIWLGGPFYLLAKRFLLTNETLSVSRTLVSALLPLTTWMISAYDGSLLALTIVAVLLVLLPWLQQKVVRSISPPAS